MRTEYVRDIADGFKELIKCPCPDPAQMRFQFRERHFDKVEVWAVWRQKQTPAVLVLQGLSRCNISVRREGQTALRGQAAQAVNREVLLPGLGGH